MSDDRRKGRRTLLLLAVVFLGPMAVAMALYFTGFAWQPGKTVEHGILYRPARALPEAALAEAGAGVSLRDKWTLMYFGDGACDDACRQALVEMRQVRRALGRDMARVQRVFLVTGGTPDADFLAREYPGMEVVGPAPAVATLARVAGGAAPGEIFLADPLGNLVMRYPAGTGMKGIHTDLKRLLKISTIG
jgi:hypothetical protein